MRAATSHVRRAVDHDGLTNIEGWIDDAVRRCGRAPVGRRSGRVLAAGHPEVEVVAHQDLDSHAPAGRMNQMRRADPATPVPDQHDHHQVGPDALDPFRVREGSPMQTVEGVAGEIAVGNPDAADVRYKTNLVGLQTHTLQCRADLLQHDPVRAARAEAHIGTLRRHHRHRGIPPRRLFDPKMARGRARRCAAGESTDRQSTRSARSPLRRQTREARRRTIRCSTPAR